MESRERRMFSLDRRSFLLRVRTVSLVSSSFNDPSESPLFSSWLTSVNYEQVLTTGTREQTRDIINGSTFYVHLREYLGACVNVVSASFKECFVALSEPSSFRFSTY